MNERRPAGWQVDGSLVLMTFIWGATFVLVKRALADSSTLLFLTIRFAAAALVLALIFRNDFRAGKIGISIRAGMLAGLCLFGGYVFQTVGLRYTTASKAAFLTGFTTPMVAVLSSIVYRRAPQMIEVLGVVVAFAGMALMTIPGGRFQIGAGDLIVSGCAVAYALHILVTGRFASEVNMGVFIVTQIATGAAVGAATFWWTEPVRLHWSAPLITALVITSLFATALAFSIQTWAQRWTNPTRTALIFAMEPVFAWITSYLLLGEMLSRRAGVGAALILGGILMVELKPFRAASLP
ncbi:MAG TPA: DMT family transporter [Bryobacteraceae bacterium]|nr:DMT family transporter [Bryobacteraceae bacterium]